MPTRILNETERVALYETLRVNLNMIADCEERKANFTAVINKEIKGCEHEANKARLQLNENSVQEDAQAELPLEE